MTTVPVPPVFPVSQPLCPADETAMCEPLWTEAFKVKVPGPLTFRTTTDIAYVVDVAAIVRPPPTRETITVPIGLHAAPLIVALNVPFVSEPLRLGSNVDVPDDPQLDDARPIAKTVSSRNRRMTHLGVEEEGRRLICCLLYTSPSPRDS